MALEQIIDAKILLPGGRWTEGACAYSEGKICYVGDQPLEDARPVLDARGGYLVPGFIDLHCHGGTGFDFMDADPVEMEEIARFHLRHGTTTMLATTMTDRWEAICAALDRIAVLLEKDTTVHGVHLEGPWLNPEQCGAQDTRKMALPNGEQLRSLVKKYPFIRRISAAPELPEGLALGQVGKELGLVMSVAHTDADFDQVEQAA